jgi:hypothetical protein
VEFSAEADESAGGDLAVLGERQRWEFGGIELEGVGELLPVVGEAVGLTGCVFQQRRGRMRAGDLTAAPTVDPDARPSVAATRRLFTSLVRR